MDRSLATLLRSLQASSNYEDATRLLPSAISLLARLSNPLNVSLLASQLLQNPLLYPQPIDLQSCRRIFSAFYTAALRFVEAEEKEEILLQFPRSNLSRSDWTKAVVKGADDESPRWRHLLLLGGILLGFEGQQHGQLPGDLRRKIESALVTASNLALTQPEDGDPNSHLCVVWVLNFTFPQLSDYHRSLLNYDILLPQLIDATYFSREGLEHGYWLGMIDSDVLQIPDNKFSWSPKSPSAVKVQDIKSRQLTTSLGPLSRLIAHSLEQIHDSRAVLVALERLSEFSRNLSLSWRQNKLSEVDVTEEREYLDSQTVEITLPILLHILRDTLFAIVICLRAVVGRLLTDARLSSTQTAPLLATRCLHILRDTYFISHRFGQTSSSQYMFVNYTAIDILNQYPQQAETFLASIRPSEPGKVPIHPLERIYDLFFLNLSEHFTLCLAPHVNEELILNATMPYIIIEGDDRLNEIYEAAHSVLLAVFAAPQNGELAARHIPYYIEQLMNSFPGMLSPRQFRLAIKSVMRLSGPPSAVSLVVPLMQPIVMEMLSGRSLHASEEIIRTADPVLESSPPVSEKTVLILSTIDCLQFLPIHGLEERLPRIAELVHTVADVGQRSLCQKRFWDVLSNGDMDVERSAFCVAWWTSRGGKELVLFGEIPEEHDYVMQGALNDDQP